MLGDQVEPGHEPAAEGGQPAGQPAGGTGAVEVGDVDAVLVAVALGEPLEPGREQGDLGRRGALLRGEHGGGVDEPGAHVAGDLEVDGAQPGRAAQRLDRAEPAVGGRRPAEADDDPCGRPARSPGRSARRCRPSSPDGSLPSAPPASARPLARAISITAVRPSSRHAASTGAPSGPVTTLVRLAPPSTSSSPSPPSDIGASSASRPSSQQAWPTAAVASARHRAAELVERRAPDDPHGPIRSTTAAVAATPMIPDPAGRVSPWPSPCASRPPCARCRAAPRRSRSRPARSATSSPPSSRPSRVRRAPARRGRRAAPVRQRVRRRRRRPLPRRPRDRGPRRPDRSIIPAVAGG